MAKEITNGGPVLFSDIRIVHHTYGKRKAEKECDRMTKHKQYRACPNSLQAVTEEQVRLLCTSLESHQKTSPFSKLLRGNDCKPLTEYTTNVTESEILCAVSDPEQSTSMVYEDYMQQNGDDANLNEGDTLGSKDVISSDKAYTNVCNGSNNIIASEEEEAVIAHIEVTQEQAKKIEMETMNQSHSEAWFKERQWRITASYFGRVCKMRKSTSPVKLANTITTQCQKQLTPLPCSWGKDNEPIAVAAYIQHMTNCKRNVSVSPTGLNINPDFPYLGASPDGLVTDTGSPDPNGVLEVKCPYKYRDLDPNQAAENKDFCSELKDGKLMLKKKHNYCYQIQGQMAITSRKWCDFVMYTKNEVSVERVAFDNEFWMTMLPTLRDFYVKGLVPILANRLHK